MYYQNTKIFIFFSFFILNPQLNSKGNIQKIVHDFMRYEVVLGLVCATLFFSTFTAFAQTPELLSVKTSEKSYEEGDAIIISGNVTAVIIDTPVTLQIFYEGNLIDIAQITVAQDGRYTHTMLAKGPYWQKDGTYIIRASYGANYMVETEFEYHTKFSVRETTDIFEVNAGSYGTFDIHYTVKGATVKDMIVDPEIFALIVIIETEDDGFIILDLPRKSIDAKKNDNTDDSYIILIDGVEVPYDENENTVDSRKITINFEDGDSDIEIIGTFVIPEFGNIVVLVLIVGIISIILISSKYRMPVKNSY